MNPETTRLHRSPDVTWRTLDGETVLLHLESGEYFSLNATGSRLWDLLDGAHSLAEAALAIAAAFDDAAPATVAADVAALAAEMLDRKLVTSDESPARP